MRLAETAAEARSVGWAKAHQRRAHQSCRWERWWARFALPTLQAAFGDALALPLQGRVAADPERMRGSAPEFAGEHLFEDLPADGLVGHVGRVPPPAVLLHLRCRSSEAPDDLGEIGVGRVQAEDQPARSDPAQRDAFGAQIVLQ